MQARNVATVLEKLRQANHRGALHRFWLHPVLTAALQTAIIMLKILLRFFCGTMNYSLLCFAHTPINIKISSAPPMWRGAGGRGGGSSKFWNSEHWKSIPFRRIYYLKKFTGIKISPLSRNLHQTSHQMGCLDQSFLPFQFYENP